jgi:hypothetical protein
MLIQSCVTPKNHKDDIYAEIYKIQRAKYGNTMFIKGLNYDRKLIPWIKDAITVNQKDTVYALELLGVQGNELFTYWNERDTVSYTSNTGAFIQTKDRLFSKYMMNLVSEWNIPQIRKEERIHGDWLPSDYIHALRIYTNRNRRCIEDIRFSYFSDPNRDDR